MKILLFKDLAKEKKKTKVCIINLYTSDFKPYLRYCFCYLKKKITQIFILKTVVTCAAVEFINIFIFKTFIKMKNLTKYLHTHTNKKRIKV